MNEPLSILVCLRDGAPLVDSGADETEKRDVRLVLWPFGMIARWHHE